MMPRGGTWMPTWLRIVIIAVLALVLWYLAATLGRSVAEQEPEGTGMTAPAAERLLT